jgi:copper chaperone CopZ
MMTTVLQITGMSCGSCVRHVDKALRGLPGVSAVEVQLGEKTARVTHAPEQAAVSALIAAVVAAGYGATARPG